MQKKEGPIEALVSSKPGTKYGGAAYGVSPETKPEDIKEFHKEVEAQVFDADGKLKILKELGIEHEVTRTSGSWEGLEPNWTVRLPKGDMDQAKLVGAILSEGMRQDAFVVQRPTPKGGIAGMAFHKTDGTPFTDAEKETVHHHVNPKRSPEGTNFSERPDGSLVFLDFSGDAEKFHRDLTTAFPRDILHANGRPHRQDGDLMNPCR